jgi:NAD+ diphosphatase
MDGLHYTAVPLDRAERFRRDEAWQQARLCDPSSRIFPLWRDRNLITRGEAAQAVALEPTADLVARAEEIVFLGLDQAQRACFAVDFSSATDAALADPTTAGQFVELRRIAAALDRGDAAVLALARGLIHWNRRHRFCGVCGAATESRHGGHVRACTASECNAQHFPRTDPAVIMLVTRHGQDGAQCLLARQASWPSGMMSTLAGFVEPGESLEEAVRREIEEETGILIASLHYRGSQPWPFPASLMLGFRGEALPGSALMVNAGELEDARWFSREEIRERRRIGLILPRRDSIARRLIEEWMDEDRDERTAMQSEEARACPAW